MQFGSDDLKIQKLHDYQFSGFSNEKKNCSNFFKDKKPKTYNVCKLFEGEFSCFVLNLGILIKKIVVNYNTQVVNIRYKKKEVVYREYNHRSPYSLYEIFSIFYRKK